MYVIYDRFYLILFSVNSMIESFTKSVPIRGTRNSLFTKASNVSLSLSVNIYYPVHIFQFNDTDLAMQMGVSFGTEAKSFLDHCKVSKCAFII